MTTAAAISVANIEHARSVIDPVFLDSPQFQSDALSEHLGMDIVLKVECVNPIRSFKGRGAEYFTYLNKDNAARPWICASAGNFGQGLAFAARKHDIPIIVYAATTANPFKIEKMRALGADVRLVGHDFDASKDACRAYAEAERLTFVEDGRDAAITEGAGTIAPELARWPEPFDAVLVPLGNGALVNGIGSWIKAHLPETRVVAVGADQAPAMERSFRERRVVVTTEPVKTIADGVATRVPVPEAVEAMVAVADEVLLLPEEDIIEAMALIERQLGLKVEGAGAVTLAAARRFRERFRGQRLGVVVSGSNVVGG